MTASITMACRQAKISENTFYYHKRNDPDFAQLVENAKAHAIDLLHTRCFQRALEGDIEPVHWQGVVVDHVRKFDSRLQIEMLRAHMPNTFKTPGTAPVNVESGDKILVLDEATRMKLIEARRKALLAMPGPDEPSPKSSHSGQVMCNVAQGRIATDGGAASHRITMMAHAGSARRVHNRPSVLAPRPSAGV